MTPSKEKSKAEVWADVFVTFLSVAVTVYVIAGKPRLSTHATFYLARSLAKVNGYIGKACLQAEQAYYRSVNLV